MFCPLDCWDACRLKLGSGGERRGQKEEMEVPEGEFGEGQKNKKGEKGEGEKNWENGEEGESSSAKGEEENCAGEKLSFPPTFTDGRISGNYENSLKKAPAGEELERRGGSFAQTGSFFPSGEKGGNREKLDLSGEKGGEEPENFAGERLERGKGEELTGRSSSFSVPGEKGAKVSPIFQFQGVEPTPYLCKKLRNYFRYRPLFTPRYRGKEISWEEGLNRLVEMLEGVEPEKILYLKGSGNMGILQNLPPLFFAQIGATFAVGSSCDGMGAKGIGMGRGKSSILPLWVIKNAERVLIWGRNVAVTNTHLLPLIAGKKVAVIDIRPTKTAKIADHFYQILPNRDYYLALLLGRLALERVGEKNLNSNGVGWEKYRHLLFRHSPEKLRQLTGLRWKEVEGLLEFLLPGAVVLTGLGVAKHREGWKSSWAIDSLFHLLGYFGKPDRGVAFLGSSSEGLNLPFSISPRRTIPLFDIHPGEFDLLFLQGGNPAESYPNRRVWEKLLSKKSIVFGRYWDRSAQLATLFIPTEGFYNKPDCRGSYFDQFFRVHFPTSHLNPFGAPPRTRQERKLRVGVEGISESNLTRFLMEKWGFPPLPSDGEIIAQIVTGSPVERVLESNSPFLEPGEFTDGQPLQIPSKSNSSYAPESFTGFYRKKIFDSPPYRNGFPTPSGKFHFLQVWLEPETPPFWVATGKGSGNLNSQFSPPEYVEIAPNPVPPLRRWVEENLSPDEVKINPTLPPYLLFAPGGKIINRYLKSEGENAYYTSLEE